MASPAPVLVDTNVWSRLFAAQKQPHPEVASWRAVLVGRPVVIAAQTRGELLFGAHLNGWGIDRIAQYRTLLDNFTVLHPTPAVVEEWAVLRAECSRLGHPLQAKPNMGDAWIAATARAFRLPLLSADQVFRGVPNLELLPAAP